VNSGRESERERGGSEREGAGEQHSINSTFAKLVSDVERTRRTSS
jgi:hypothetical protein